MDILQQYEGEDLENEILLHKAIESEDNIKVQNICSYPYPRFYIIWKERLIFLKQRRQILLITIPNVVQNKVFKNLL